MAKHALLVALVGMLILTWGSAAPSCQSDSPPQEKKNGAGTAELIRQLNSAVSLPDRVDQPFGDALQLLGTLLKAPILIDDAAFVADNNDNDVRGKNIKCEKFEKVRFSTILDNVVGQIQGAYLVKPDYILIIPRSRLDIHVWGHDQAPESPDGMRLPKSPVVSAVFENTPLEAALKELANTTGNTVVLDRKRAAELAQAGVTATLLNVPLDTAVRVLANQAELEMVSLNNVLYVTTPDNAVTLRPAPPQMMPVMGGGLGGIGMAGPTR